MTLFSGYDAATLAIIALVFFAAGMIKGVIAFAFPLVVVALLANVIDPAKAIAIGLIPGLVTNATQIRADRLVPDLKRFWPMLAVLAPSIWLGAATTAVLERGLLMLTLGVMTVAFSLFLALSPRFHIKPSRALAVSLPVGLISGFFGGVSSVFGPPIAAYMVAIRLNADEFVSAVSLIFTIGWLILIAAFGAFGMLGREEALLSLALIAPAMLGLFLGARLRRLINQDVFRNIVLAGLCISGLRLVMTNIYLLN